MAVSHFERIEVSEDTSTKTVNTQRTANSMVIGEAKSSPVGVDWHIIRTMKDKVLYSEDGD